MTQKPEQSCSYSIDVAIFQKRNVNSKMKSVRNWQYTVISPTPSQKHNITTTYASGKQFPCSEIRGCICLIEMIHLKFEKLQTASKFAILEYEKPCFSFSFCAIYFYFFLSNKGKLSNTDVGIFIFPKYGKFYAIKQKQKKLCNFKKLHLEMEYGHTYR